MYGQAYASLDAIDKKTNDTQVVTLSLSDRELGPFITGLNTSKGLRFLSGTEG